MAKNGGQLFPHHLDSLVIELGQLQYCLAVSRGEALPLLFWREGENEQISSAVRA